MTSSFHITKMNFTFSSVIRRPALPGGIYFLLLLVLSAAPARLHAKPKPKPFVACSITGPT
jgi:hypothetical protein